LAEGAVRSVERALSLLDVLAARGVATLTELAQATSMSVPTVHRLIQTLQRHGYVRRQPGREYTLGMRNIVLGDVASRLVRVRVIPYLHEIVAATGETANAAMLDHDAVSYFAQVPSPHSMRTFPELDRRVDVHSSGVGKVLLGMLPVNEARRIAARSGLPRKTPDTITDLDDLMDELARVRQQGFAIDAGEEEIGARCLAVAVPSVSFPPPHSRCPARRGG
jgi:IclR family acetate operon transcriptional repressor